MKDDVYFLKEAIAIGNQKAKPYNFGAVVVKDGKTISKAFSYVQETNNPTLHAECAALIIACQDLGTHNIDGCTLYASHEPCIMCISCAAWAHIDRVVYCTPASAQKDVMYELKDYSVKEFAAKLPRPMKVEQINV